MDDVRVAEMILQQSIENVRILGATQDADRIEAALQEVRQERDLRQEWLDAMLGTVQRMKDDLIHKDAVIKALQQQYVDHMRPLVALREAVGVYVKGEELDDPRITDEGTALYDLRRALDACRE